VQQGLRTRQAIEHALKFRHVGRGSGAGHRREDRMRRNRR
jgi:hypothetical protein